MKQENINRMQQLGYELLFDIFPEWESVKDEILLPNRKSGAGNGTVHIFLGAADSQLRTEFSDYYESVEKGDDTAEGAINIIHFFDVANLVGGIPVLAEWLLQEEADASNKIQDIMLALGASINKVGFVDTTSSFKLSLGSSKLRPYFKQFLGHGIFFNVVRELLFSDSCYKISLFKNRNGKYATLWEISFKRDSLTDGSISHHVLQKTPLNLPLQQIYYGAPGTGKSHEINEHTKGQDVIRTTFHPDSDYSTFVGAYKPTSTEIPMRDVTGRVIKDADGKDVMENRIIYEFVNQAFLQAYIKAWKKQGAAEITIANGKYLITGMDDDNVYWRNISNNNTTISNTAKKETIKNYFDHSGEDNAQGSIAKHLKVLDSDFEKAWSKLKKSFTVAAPQYLVIEEINRGNCAQIFGDLFQLLDRNAWGFSEYPIKADNDMKKQLQKAFKGLSITKAGEINALFNGNDIVSDVLNGECLLLPNNLFIWATMNTSDQSLFPIDSAFKRRWDWRYMPIDTEKESWKIRVNGTSYSWTSFLNIINEIVHDKTQSEDKQLGFYFCKAKEGVIDAETFVGKVLFYLWNDVFKDYGFDDEFFEDEKLPDGTFKPLAFKSFYDVKTRKVIENQAEKFLLNLKVERIEDMDDELEEDEDGNRQTEVALGRDYTKFSINGIGRYAKNNLAAECVKKYIELNPNKSVEDVLSDWLSLGSIVPHFIESKEQFNARTDNSKRSHEISCDDTVIYVAHNGYGSNGKVLVLKDAVNGKDWGIIIEEA